MTGDAENKNGRVGSWGGRGRESNIAFDSCFHWKPPSSLPVLIFMIKLAFLILPLSSRTLVDLIDEAIVVI